MNARPHHRARSHYTIQFVDDTGDIEKVLERGHRGDEIERRITEGKCRYVSADQRVIRPRGRASIARGVIQAAGVQPARKPIGESCCVVTRTIYEVDARNTV